MSTNDVHYGITIKYLLNTIVVNLIFIMKLSEYARNGYHHVSLTMPQDRILIFITYIMFLTIVFIEMPFITGLSHVRLAGE